MPVITKIESQKKKDRFNIFVDGKFAFVLSAESLVKAGLKINHEISSDRIKELIKENEFQKALDKTFNFLSFRPRSKKEISDYLSRKKIGDQLGKMIFQKLEDLQMINDLDFTKWWAGQRQTFRPTGKRLLVLELRKKGIAKEIIDRVFESLPEEPEEEQAVKVLSKKERQFKGLPRQAVWKKASGFLLRRGFSYQAVKKAVVIFLKKE